MEETFGPHITLDLKGCPKEILSNYQLHFDFLKSIPELIHMTAITQPYVFPYEGLIPEDRGITGIVIIAESHISVHSFQEKGWCFIDIFSCKAFDYEKAIGLIKEIFQPEDCEINIISRGKNFDR